MGEFSGRSDREISLEASYPARLGQILEALTEIRERELRAEVLIEFADRWTDVPPSIAQRPFPREHQVPACESEAYAWLIEGFEGKLKVYFAVENPQGISAKALAQILSEGLSGSEPTQILMVDEQIVDDIFGKGISMGKGEGLRGMIRMVKMLAYRRLKSLW